jgi:predicted AlkP superfamily phosphohydrolase/phosphomutase
MFMKVLLLGIDGTPYNLIKKHRKNLPVLDSLMKKSVHGPLETIVPAITSPAWMCMLSGRTPGEMGVYGFKERVGNSYSDFIVANSTTLKAETVVDIIGRNGKKTGLLAVPQTYPPRSINGFMVTGFLTPSASQEFTFPRELKQELLSIEKDYLFDVYDLKEENKQQALKDIYEITKQNFVVLKHLLKKQWDFMAVVLIGPDRLHHGFWKQDQKPKFKNAIKKYYQYLDSEIGRLLESLDDETVLIIASDHGAKELQGSFFINQWLLKEGYLKLRPEPDRCLPFSMAQVDWSKTRAWAWGGYYARIFINLEGREPEGIVPSSQYHELRKEIASKIEGLDKQNKVFFPDKEYPDTRGSPPDLIAYFKDLSVKADERVGSKELFLVWESSFVEEANHSKHGVFILHDPRKQENLEKTASIYDIAPTILKLLEVQNSLPGKTLG